MSSFSTRALTLLSSVFGACGLLLVGVAVSTDYWLLMEEGIVLQQNQTNQVKMALHSGLWRVCFVAGLCPCTRDFCCDVGRLSVTGYFGPVVVAELPVEADCVYYLRNSMVQQLLSW